MKSPYLPPPVKDQEKIHSEHKSQSESSLHPNKDCLWLPRRVPAMHFHLFFFFTHGKKGEVSRQTQGPGVPSSYAGFPIFFLRQLNWCNIFKPCQQVEESESICDTFQCKYRTNVLNQIQGENESQLQNSQFQHSYIQTILQTFLEKTKGKPLGSLSKTWKGRESAPLFLPPPPHMSKLG